MEQEQVVTEEQRPSDEQATAFLNGNRQAVEPQEQKPVAQNAEAPAPAASQAPPAKTEIELLREELNRVKSEVGQFRKVRQELSRPPETKPVTPQSWAKMSPEEQATLEELVDHAWSQKYGKDWQEVQSLREQNEISAKINNVEQLSRHYAGELHKELDPIMGKLYDGLRSKAQEGDEEAEELLTDIKAGRRAAVKYLVDLAKQEYSQGVEAKGQQANEAKAAQAKKAGVTLGSSPQAAPKPDILKNLPSDPAKAAEMLREELIKRGAL